MDVFTAFGKSFSSLDRRFFLVWSMDVMFYVAIAIVLYLSLFRFGDISARVDELANAPGSEQVVQELTDQLFAVFGTLAVMSVLIFAFYAICQTLIWSMVLGHKLDAKFFAFFAWYLIFAGFIASVVSLSIVLLFSLLFVLAVQLAGPIALLVGILLFWIEWSMLMPLSIFPSYAYFKERRFFHAIGRMFHDGFSTLPKLWPHYLLGGAVMGVVTQLFRFFSGLDPNLGGFILMVLLVSPVLAWYRFYIVGLLEQHRRVA